MIIIMKNNNEIIESLKLFRDFKNFISIYQWKFWYLTVLSMNTTTFFLSGKTLESPKTKISRWKIWSRDFSIASRIAKNLEI